MNGQARSTTSVANDPSLPLGVPIFCNAQGQGTVATLTPGSKRPERKAKAATVLRLRALLRRPGLSAQIERAVDQTDMTVGLRKIA
jgi:hypothetical protein